MARALSIHVATIGQLVLYPYDPSWSPMRSPVGVPHLLIGTADELLLLLKVGALCNVSREQSKPADRVCHEFESWIFTYLWTTCASLCLQFLVRVQSALDDT